MVRFFGAFSVSQYLIALVATAILSCTAIAEPERLSVGIQLLDVPTLEQDLSGTEPFKLEPPSTEVRVATRAAIEDFGDLVEQYNQLQAVEELDWDDRFSTNTEGELVAVERPDVEDDFDLLPATFELKSSSDMVGLVSAHSTLNGDVDSISLYYEEGDGDAELSEDGEGQFNGPIRVSPEPSAWTLTIALMVSLVVVGFCARWLRPRREDVQRIDF